MTTFEVTEGVYGIDIGLFDAGSGSVYLFDGDRPVLVDAGAASSAETIVDGLADCGVEPSDLHALVLSHVHADHSGAAGHLVEAAPDLDVYIHEMTAGHLSEPSGLIESSKQAMGEHFAAIGEQKPVPEENIVGVSDDGTTIDTGDGRLELIHGPGHSPDHFAVWNPDRELLFAAECLGIYLERADRWLPPGSLPNFDPDVLADTIDRLRDLDPEHVVFPHFGVWPDDPAEAFETAERELWRFDEQILDIEAAADSREETKETVADELIDVSPPYDEAVESFYASLITDGYLNFHGKL